MENSPKMQKPILVVEDDEAIRDALQEVFSEDAETVVTAVDGEAALTYLAAAETLPGLIFLDLMMPRLDGRAFLERKAKITRLKDLPVVVITASRHVVSDPSIVGQLRKPVNLDDLRSYAQRYASDAPEATTSVVA